MRTAICAAVISEKKEILLVKKKQVWILPGGKLEPDESDLECLCREVSEEIPGTILKDFRFYNEFEGNTPHSKTLIKARIYFANLKPYVNGNLKRPAAEISAVEYAGNLEQYNLSDITRKIVDSLIKDKYL